MHDCMHAASHGTVYQRPTEYTPPIHTCYLSDEFLNATVCLVLLGRHPLITGRPSVPFHSPCRDYSVGKLGRVSSPSDRGNTGPPLALGPGLQAVGLAAGQDHTCALLQPGGMVKCWGWVGPGAPGPGGG